MGNDHELKLKFTADTASAQKGIEGLSKSHGELMRSARELSRAFPEVAAGLRLLAGPAGAIFVGIEAFNKAKEALDEYNKALDEQIAKNADPMWLESIEAKKAAMEELDAAFVKFIADSKGVITATAATVAALNATVEQIHTLAKEGGDLNDSIFHLDLAKLKADLDNGLTLIEQFEEAKAKLEIDARHRKEAAEEKGLQDEIDEKTLGYRNLNADRDAATQRAARDEAALKRDKGRVTSDQGTLDELNKKIAAETEDVAGAMEDKSLISTFKPEGRKLFAGDLAKDQLAIDNYNADVANAASVKSRLEDTKARIPGEETSLAQDEGEAKTAAEKMGSLKESIDQLTQQLQIMHQGAPGKMADEDLATLIGTKSGGQAYAADHAADIMSRGGKVSGQVQEMMQSIAGMMAGHGVTLQQAINLLKGHTNDLQFQQREIQVIEAQRASRRTILGNGN